MSFASAKTEIPAAREDDSVAAIQALDSLPGLLRATLRLTGMRFVTVAHVAPASWTACAVLDEMGFGMLPGDRVPVETTLCHEICQRGQPIVFSHASADPVFSAHHTPRLYGLESYVSVPIVLADGRFFGTLCALDSRPVPLDEAIVVETMGFFAGMIASQLDGHNRLAKAEAALEREADLGELREQFLAVVGHDLRSPLQVARLVAEQLASDVPAGRLPRLATMLDVSLGRMAGLIDDIMDFARGRLGGGIPLSLSPRFDLDRVVEAAVDEMRHAHPALSFETSLAFEGEAMFDAKRLQQLLANLLNNAVAHGDPSYPIRVSLADDSPWIDIRVTNQGKPIPPAAIATIFHPFVRPDRQTPRPGLGLGLYIAAEVARGHGGSLDVEWSDERGTQFLLRLPRRRATALVSALEGLSGRVTYPHGLAARFVARRSSFGLITSIDLVTEEGYCFDTVDFPDDVECHRRAATDEGALNEILRVLDEARGLRPAETVSR